jgi:hypothetical protein
MKTAAWFLFCAVAPWAAFALADVQYAHGQQGAYLSTTCNDAKDCTAEAHAYCVAHGARSVKVLEPAWQRRATLELRFWCTGGGK